MPILNNRQYKILENSVVPVYRKKSLEASYCFKQGLYWYVEFFNIHSFKEELWLKVLPAGILQSIRNKKIFLLISNYAESFLSIVDHVYELLIIKFSIPEEQLILMTGARDILPTIKITAKKFSKKEIKSIWSSDCERKLHIAETSKKIDSNHYITYSYNKKFINLNRNWRVHRPTFVSLLISHNLIKDGYVSLIESDKYNWKWEKIWDYILEKHPNFKNLFLQHKDTIVNSTPLIVDKTSSDINPEWHQPELRHIYNNSYFSIISETNYYTGESRFITEKTLMAIINYHPFILLSLPKSLEILRERGYKTFHPLINEDYDNELNDEKRMYMVLEETKRLCSLNGDELKLFVDACHEICQHNYNNLIYDIKPYVLLN